MAKDVKCSVSTCLYYDKSKCTAHEIKVAKCGCSSPCDEKETECETFKLK